MGTYYEPRTWGVGSDKPNYKVWNRELYDNIEFLLNPPMCRLRQQNVQTLTNVTWTAINWDYDEVDTDNMHSVSTQKSRIKPNTPGWYIGFTGVSWRQLNTANDTQGRRLVQVRKNNSNYITRLDSRHSGLQNRDKHIKSVAFMVVMNGTTDYLETYAYQDSGVSMQTSGGAFGPEYWPECYLRWYRAL